eukprot:TRINITY_DN15640_c0_g1_i1.p1 TRINITY_DN15640_c0_g1~~TRINITY_DN15640_c0_g1_i1.p1  ORF type:complete len:109 (+),score=17.20 TRINITY_DN15640_c0_g1_i1:205-531(+)
MEEIKGKEDISGTASAAYFMEKALEQARIALRNLEVPVGCVLVEEGEVIASGSNKTNESRNGTRHAEMEAIDKFLDACSASRLTQEQVFRRFRRLYVESQTTNSIIHE